MNLQTQAMDLRDAKGGTYSEALQELRRTTVAKYLDEHPKAADFEIMEATAIPLGAVRSAFGELRALGHPAVVDSWTCLVCSQAGATDECEKCHEPAHSDCLDESGGWQVCRDCAAVLEAG